MTSGNTLDASTVSFGRYIYLPLKIIASDMWIVTKLGISPYFFHDGLDSRNSEWADLWVAKERSDLGYREKTLWNYERKLMIVETDRDVPDKEGQPTKHILKDFAHY